MILVNLIQGSEEWHTWRMNGIGASECAAIMDKNRFKTPYGVWKDKMFGDERFTNEDIERGVSMEEEARNWISEKLDKKFIPMCGYRKERPWQLASLDCYQCHDEGVLAGEIKCPRQKKILEIQKNGVPDYWLWQMQHQMSVTGADTMFFLAYSPENQFLTWVARNDFMIDELNRREEIFYKDYMLTFTPPPFTEEEAAFAKKLA